MKYNTKDHPRHFPEPTTRFSRLNEICDLCENRIYLASSLYCFTCKSYFHERCLTITDPQVHLHPLSFMRRQNSLTCDVCGLIGTDHINMYTCVPCDFFVHRNCILLPKVIKITRHLHRLLHTHIPKREDWRCKICHGTISYPYEGYTCSDKTCDYVAHAYCATRREVWGGKDLTEVPEEESNHDEIEIDGVGIHHFSHEHNLLRFLVDVAKEQNEHVCEACILPVDKGSFFYCEQCNFALHDACARLPKEKEHMLNRHPLVLLQDNTTDEHNKGLFTCSVCNQDSCGFVYKCKEGCEFRIDVKCASFVEPFNHAAHQHPLYLEQQFDNRSKPYSCMTCGLSSMIVAACFHPSCGFSMDLKCTTLPGLLLKGKYDTHPLTLSSMSVVVNGTLTICTTSFPLCEICEEVNGTNLFYMCKECCTTIHVECILGKHLYLKPGRTIMLSGFESDIVSNKGVLRRICHKCQCLCQDKLVFINKQVLDRSTYGKCFCSIKCFRFFIESNPFRLLGNTWINLDEVAKLYGGKLIKNV